jgi:large subunit ribosomal protein L9
MKIILRQDVENLGSIGEVVAVKDGYARNFLIPQGFAYYASPKALRLIEAEKRQHAVRMEKLRVEAELLREKLAETQVTIPMQVGEEDRLFGSVTSQMIGKELADRGFNIDRRLFLLDEPIKSLGIFDVKIKLHPEVVGVVKVWVISA